LELRQLRYFVTVARELHFTRAAERLGIAQPPLSVQIRALEAELGVQLFERSNRRVALTAAGAALLTRAEPILAMADETRRAVRHIGDEERGQLTVAALPTAAGLLLPPAITRFQVHYPHVELRVIEGGSTTIVRRMRAGEADIGIIRLPVAVPTLVVEPLLAADEERVLVVAPRHRLARRTTVAIRELTDEPFLVGDRAQGPALYDAVIEACRAAGFAPRVVCDGARYETILRLVAAGLGIALMPRLAVALTQHPVVAVALDPPVPAGALAIATPRGMPRSAPCTLLIESLRDAARDAWLRLGGSALPSRAETGDRNAE
jgi:LysR family transcriptional activator of glutamate synthase operon